MRVKLNMGSPGRCAGGRHGAATLLAKWNKIPSLSIHSRTLLAFVPTAATLGPFDQQPLLGRSFVLLVVAMRRPHRNPAKREASLH